MKNQALFIIISIFLLFLAPLKGIEIIESNCHGKINPIGIDETPLFGWKMVSENRNENQSAYHIIVADNPEDIERFTGNIWNSEKVLSKKSIQIKFEGKKLEPASKYYWRVKVWDKKDNESHWSKINTFITGIKDENLWKASYWIGYEEMDEKNYLAPGVEAWGHDLSKFELKRPVIPYFRKSFQIDKEVREAFLFISGLGQYEANFNGQKISDHFLSPGWTYYEKTCLYNSYEITNVLNSGENVLGAIVGNGMHNINNERYKKFVVAFGYPKLRCILKITFADGTVEQIVTDESWITRPSPVTYSSIYGGEDYDATKETPGWDCPGSNVTDWKNVEIVRNPGGRMVSQITYPIKAREQFEPIDIMHVSSDTLIYDFGQNISGIVSIDFKGMKGKKVKLIPGELLTENGYINQKATGRSHYYEYTCKGDSMEHFEPRFTYYGFRYLQVMGAVDDSLSSSIEFPEILKVKLLHTRNSAPFAGSFSCSNDFLNDVFRLIDYAIKSNFQSVLTDCPHRERLGWLEQTYLMGGSVHFNYDVYHLYKNTLNNLRDAQHPNGLIPSIAPEFVTFPGAFHDSPEWGSAGIALPWLVYKWYGDSKIIADNWSVMIQYMNYLQDKSKGYILMHGLGDWYDLGPVSPGVSQLTPQGLTATAIYYHNAVLVSQMASVLKKENEVEKWSNLAKEIKKAFNSKYFNNETKVYASGSQTAMAMPMCLGLVNEADKKKVLENLIDSVNYNNKALTAGDIGFHFLIQTLTDNGLSELIYEMNNRDDVPGYGYQLKKGATSLTESWEALPIVSNNHLMLGHLMQWFYEGLGGIYQQENSSAYEKISIKPVYINDIDWVKSHYFSPYGKIVSEWKRENYNIILNVQIPVNSETQIYIPTHFNDITESGKNLGKSEIIAYDAISERETSIRIGSGNYIFKFPYHH